MTTRKMLAVGLVAVAGVLAVSADAQAFGKKKRGGGGGGCNSCGGSAPVYHQAAGGCGGCGGGYAMAGAVGGYAVAPEAMPATGTIRTAAGTDGGTVVPAGGTVTNPTVVVPAGGYYLNGQYVVPAGGTTVAPPGVFQGVIGSPTMYYGNNPGNGGRRGGIFRR